MREHATSSHASPKSSRSGLAKARRPGRPSTAAKVDARGRILDAAIAQFAERGIAATPLRAIALATGVTPALLHYYFTSKDSLVETLLAERVAPFVAVSAAPLLAPLKSPRATLRKFLETHMRNLAAHAWMPRLMAREVLSEGGALRERVAAQFSGVLAPKIMALIVQAQRKHEIRGDLDPRLIGLSMVSLAVFPFAAAPIWRGVLKPAATELGAEDLITHTLALFDSALESKHAKSRR
jgi:AcrR family transcriptional regulator